MQCHCCEQTITLARKVKLRPVRHYDPNMGGPDSVAYQSYREDATFRWAFICNACYRLLDNELGVGEIPGHGEFNLASASRGDKATTIDQPKYEQFQRKEAARMGLEL